MAGMTAPRLAALAAAAALLLAGRAAAWPSGPGTCEASASELGRMRSSAQPHSYTFGLPAGGYIPGETYDVVFDSPDVSTVRGLLLYASEGGAAAATHGSFAAVANTKVTCGGLGHRNAIDKALPLTVQWTAPDSDQGELTFHGVGVPTSTTWSIATTAALAVSTTPPVASGLAASGETTDGVTLTLDTDVKALCSCVAVQGSVVPAPTPAQVLAGQDASGDAAAAAASTSTRATTHSLDLDGLALDEMHRAFCVAQAVDGHPSAVLNAGFSTLPDTTAPTFDTFEAASLAGTSVDASVELDEPVAELACVAIEGAAAAAPSLDQVFGGKDSADADAAASAAATSVSGPVALPLAGLAEKTAYTLYCAANDASGNERLSDAVEVTTLDETAPAFDTFGVTTPAFDQVQVAVSVDEEAEALACVALEGGAAARPSAAQIEAGQTSAGGTAASSASAGPGVTFATFELDGLVGEQEYTVHCVARDAADNAAFAGPEAVTTPEEPDTTPPVFVDASVASVQNVSAAVQWEVDEPAAARCVAVEGDATGSPPSAAQVAAGQDAAGDAAAASDEELALQTTHALAFDGLAPETLYTLFCSATDGEANAAVSAGSLFTTLNAANEEAAGENAPNVTAILARDGEATGTTLTVLVGATAAEATVTCVAQAPAAAAPVSGPTLEAASDASVVTAAPAAAGTGEGAASSGSVTIGSLEADTEYRVWCVARSAADGVGLVSSAGTLASTADTVAPEFSAARPVVAAVSAAGVATVTVALNEPGRACCVPGADVAVAAVLDGAACVDVPAAGADVQLQLDGLTFAAGATGPAPATCAAEDAAGNDVAAAAGLSVPLPDNAAPVSSAAAAARDDVSLNVTVSSNEPVHARCVAADASAGSPARPASGDDLFGDAAVLDDADADVGVTLVLDNLEGETTYSVDCAVRDVGVVPNTVLLDRVTVATLAPACSPACDADHGECVRLEGAASTSCACSDSYTGDTCATPPATLPAVEAARLPNKATLGGGLTVHWQHNATLGLVRYGVTGSSAGYAALGFPSSSGRMAPSIAWIFDSDDSLGEFKITAKSGSAITPLAASELSDVMVSRSGDAFSFAATRAVTTEEGGTIFAAGATQEFIYARGSGALAYHGSSGRGSARVDVGTGEATSVTLSDKYFKAHGVCMALAWGLLLPVGAIFGKFGKALVGDPAWFTAHRAAQSVGVLLSIVGGFMAYEAVEDRGSEHSRIAHAKFGAFLIIGGVVQALGGALRAHKGGQYRTAWEWFHHVLGWVLVVGAMFNIYGGLDNYPGGASSVFNVVWAIAVSAYLATFVLLFFRARAAAKAQRDVEAKSTELGSTSGSSSTGGGLDNTA